MTKTLLKWNNDFMPLTRQLLYKSFNSFLKKVEFAIVQIIIKNLAAFSNFLNPLTILQEFVESESEKDGAGFERSLFYRT